MTRLIGFYGFAKVFANERNKGEAQSIFDLHSVVINLLPYGRSIHSVGRLFIDDLR